MISNKIGLLIHDLSHILSELKVLNDFINDFIRESLYKTRHFDMELESSLDKQNSLIDEANFLVRRHEIIDAIENSNFDIYSKIHIDLLSRLINREKTIYCSNRVLWDIGIDESELLSKYINADPFYFTAINCILDNAVKYAYVGSIININLHHDKLVITNVGIPIQEDEMIHLYENGYRGKAAKSCNSRGSGLGLFIAKKVLDKYESTISITSEPIFERNKEVESLLVRFINLHDSISHNYFNKEISEVLTDIEYEAAKKTIKEICNIYEINYDSKFHYINKSSIMKWLRYWANKKSKFTKEEVKEDAIIFFQPIAKVTVTIKYGKEKENINR